MTYVSSTQSQAYASAACDGAYPYPAANIQGNYSGQYTSAVPSTPGDSFGQHAQYSSCTSMPMTVPSQTSPSTTSSERDSAEIAIPRSKEELQSVAQNILLARKSWKTMKGKSEQVWSPQLEQALVEALLLYQPTDSPFSRALGRFPKRNRFISDHIFQATGIRRSPKQVGSRLQQLKDIPGGRDILNHFAHMPQTPTSPSTSALTPFIWDANNLQTPASPSSPIVFSPGGQPHSAYPRTTPKIQVHVILDCAPSPSTSAPSSYLYPLTSSSYPPAMPSTPSTSVSASFPRHSPYQHELHQRTRARSATTSGAGFPASNGGVGLSRYSRERGLGDATGLHKVNEAKGKTQTIRFRGNLASPNTVHAADNLIRLGLNADDGESEVKAFFPSRQPVAAKSDSLLSYRSGEMIYQESHTLVLRHTADDNDENEKEQWCKQEVQEDEFSEFNYCVPLMQEGWKSLLAMSPNDIEQVSLVQNIVSNLDSPGARRGETLLSIEYSFSMRGSGSSDGAQSSLFSPSSSSSYTTTASTSSLLSPGLTATMGAMGVNSPTYPTHGQSMTNYNKPHQYSPVFPQHQQERHSSSYGVSPPSALSTPSPVSVVDSPNFSHSPSFHGSTHSLSPVVPNGSPAYSHASPHAGTQHHSPSPIAQPSPLSHTSISPSPITYEPSPLTPMPATAGGMFDNSGNIFGAQQQVAGSPVVSSAASLSSGSARNTPLSAVSSAYGSTFAYGHPPPTQLSMPTPPQSTNTSPSPYAGVASTPIESPSPYTPASAPFDCNLGMVPSQNTSQSQLAAMVSPLSPISPIGGQAYGNMNMTVANVGMYQQQPQQGNAFYAQHYVDRSL